MNLLREIPESAMVAAFLKAELESERFSVELKSIIRSLAVNEEIITRPDEADEHENVLREKVLGEWRGYRQNRKMFKGFPIDLNWYEAELSHSEVGSLHYVDYSYWNELSDHTKLVSYAVDNIQKGKIVFGVKNDRFTKLADEIRSGSHNFEPMILWGEDVISPLTILEGHVRATAFGLVGRIAPDTINVIVGLRSHIKDIAH